MALDAELSNLKSAGTYRFERDLSTISNDTTTFSNLRLVVGFSKVGPFNTPMLVTNQSQFIKLYGNIDRSLEKRGSYFHRSALVALSAGPILCLNLLNLDPDVDQVPQKSFSVNTKDLNKPLVTLPLVSIYDTDKFWFPSEQCYLDSIERYLSNDSTQDILNGYNFEKSNGYTENILHFTNVGKKPISIIVKKASSYATTGYECTLKEWYGEGEVPEYLNPTSFVSDYMVEVYVVSGDFGPSTVKSSGIPTFTDLDDDGSNEIVYRYDQVNDLETTNANYNNNPYARFTSDIVYQSYFDERGFIRKDRATDTTDTKLMRFLNLPSVNLIGKYTGSLIPNFVTKLGQNIWIQKLVNDDTSTTGLMCAENVEAIENVEILDNTNILNEKIDIVGHNIYSMMKTNKNNSGKLNFLSYNTEYSEITQELSIICDANNDLSLIESGHDCVAIYINKGFDTNTSSYKWELSRIEYGGNTYDVEEGNDNITISTGETINISSGLTTGTTLEINLTKEIFTNESNFQYGTQVSKIKAWTNGDTTHDNLTGWVCKFEEKNPLFTDIKSYVMDSDEKFTIGNAEYSLSDLHTSSKLDSPIITLQGNEILLPLNSNIVSGDNIVSYIAKNEDDDKNENTYPFSRLTRVVEVRSVYADTSDDSEVAERYYKVAIKVICSDEIDKSAGFIRKFKTVDQFADRLQWTCLKGYKLRDELCPNGTNERQNEILDMLREEPRFNGTKSNLYKTLCDRDYVQWRYLVDTFGYGIEEESKSVYTLLCQGRQSALAIINCPSQADFKKSIDPSFINNRGSVEAQYIAEGGDYSKTPAFLYSLPKAENGASWGAYYYPYLKISDLSAPKSVPPAAYVSNLYMAKYNAGNAWSIVAGQRRGVISGNQVIGVEATLVHENRDWLEPVGINSIIWENGVGVEIYANKTAKQTPKSALSSTHVRECCIYIQDNIESILRRYVFEMNTAQTRLEIKTLVDNFLETIKANGGVYEYKTIMDTSNNTQEVIDNNMGVIDIYIEPVRGLEILTQRLTVMKTGGIAAGAFE